MPTTTRLFPFLAAGVLICAISAPALAQSAADSAGIRQAALDYIEGWYEGDADRMARSLHPDLVKRIVQPGPQGDRLTDMTASQLVEATRRRASAGTSGAGRRDVRVLDIFQGMALVRVDAEEWVDHMHVARWNGEWRIVNVLWAMR